MQQQKFRHELKHYINYSDYLSLRQRLRAVTKPDSNVGPDGTYRIRSLYFDNVQDKVLREKLDGINNREKFRLRYYGDDTDWIRLEKKSKINGLCSKVAAPVTREECERLLSGETGWMAGSGRELLVELYAKMNFQQLRPRVVVDYIREPFVYEPGNVRITIDSAIHTGLYSTDFFNQELPTVAAERGGTMILEIKFDEFLPEIIADIVQTGSRQATAFSKYAVCRIYG